MNNLAKIRSPHNFSAIPINRIEETCICQITVISSNTKHSTMKHLLLFLTLSLSCFCYGQDDNIQSDRPGQTFSAATVGQGVLQLQSGVFVNRQSVNIGIPNLSGLASGFNTLSHSLDIRYGINNNLEITSRLSYGRATTRVTGGLSVSDRSVTLWAPGLRYEILSSDHKGPSISVLGEVNIIDLVDSSDPIFPNVVQPQVLFLYSQNLSNLLTLSSNLGAVWIDNFLLTTGIYTLNLSASLSDNLSAYVELFGSFGNSGFFTITFDGGVAYLINSNLQLDLSVGGGRNEGFNQFIADFGVSWRLKK